jgi:O-antigen/teichoic acid export membrane protein
MAASSYSPAAPLVVWIVLGYVFLGFYFIPMNGITIGGGRSGFVWITGALGAASNVALLFIFVPSGGITAAAIADAAAYLVLFLGISVYAHRPENPVEYRWAQILPLFAAAAAIYVAARLTTPDSGGTSIVLRCCWTFAFLIACAVKYGRRLPGFPSRPAAEKTA